MRGSLAVALLATAGCVTDAFVSRDPAAFVLDAATADEAVDERPASASLLLQVTVIANGLQALNADDFETSVSVTSSRAGSPADIDVSLTTERRRAVLPRYATGLYGGTLRGYDPSLALLVVDADGGVHSVALGNARIHVLRSPLPHEHLPAGLPFTVSWMPAGGAQATLLSPGGALDVPDEGVFEAPADALDGLTGEFPVRLRRATNSPLDDFAPGSLLRVEIINGVVAVAQ